MHHENLLTSGAITTITSWVRKTTARPTPYYDAIRLVGDGKVGE